MPRRRQSFDPFTPTKIFSAILIASLYWIAPVVFPQWETRPGEPEAKSATVLSRVSADPPDVCSDACKVWYCGDKVPGGGCLDWTFHCGGCDKGGGGGNQPPTITANLNCSAPGANNWCIGALSLDLTASDPQGQSLIISGDVNGNNFTCTENPCSIPLPEGTGTINYRADSATGLSANGSTTYQLDATTPQITGNINGSLGNGGWYVTQTVISAFADDSLSGLASFEMNADNTGWIPYSDTTFSDGIHSIQYRATDNAGNVTETAVQTVMVDTVPPTLNARTALNVRETLHYELTDAMSGLSQFTISVADKDNLQPPSASVWALTGNAAGGDFRWHATFGDAVATIGWHPLTMTVTDAAGNQTTVSGSIEVKHNDLLYMGLVQPNNNQAQSNPSSGGSASGATAGGMPMPGIAEAPVIVPPAPVVEPAPAGTENPTPAAETPAQTDNPLAGMRAQSGSSNFTAGNQSATTPTANPSILWGAAASAMLGATVAEWQRKRDEEKARLVAMRNSGGGGGEEEGPGKKKSPGRTAYEKMMQQKHIVGELQNKLNEKAREKAAEKAADKARLIARNEDRAPIDMAKVNALLAAQSAREKLIARNEDQAPVDMAKVEQIAQNNVYAARWAGVASAWQGREETASGAKPLAVPARDDGPPQWYEFWKDGWNKDDAGKDFTQDWNDFKKNWNDWWNALWRKDDDGGDAPVFTPTAAPTPMTQTPTKTLHPDIATIIALQTASTPLPTRTPLPTPTFAPNYLDFGIETKGLDQQHIQIVSNAAYLTGKKLVSYIPESRGIPDLAFRIAMGSATIVIDPQAHIDNYGGNCLTTKNSLLPFSWKNIFASDTYLTAYDQIKDEKIIQTSVKVTTLQTIVCKAPPTESNLIHEFEHLLINTQTLAKNINIYDLVQPIQLSDGTKLDFHQDGYWMRQGTGFIQGEYSWEHRPLDGDRISGVAKNEHSADMFLNSVYDGTGNSNYGFTNDPYGDARRQDMDRILREIFGQ